MKKKKIKRSTFSDCPSWKNKKQQAKYENEKHILLKDLSFINKMSKIEYNIEGRWI